MTSARSLHINKDMHRTVNTEVIQNWMSLLIPCPILMTFSLFVWFYSISSNHIVFNLEYPININLKHFLLIAINVKFYVLFHRKIWSIYTDGCIIKIEKTKIHQFICHVCVLWIRIVICRIEPNHSIAIHFNFR